jgi:hypothetical protein
MTRGQATVELALGTLVLVPTLLFGLHFAELAWLSMKTHEAAASALWDTTALRLHDFTQDEVSSRFWTQERATDEHHRTPAARATWLYSNFDGARGGDGAGQLRLLETTATAPSVSCDARALTGTARHTPWAQAGFTRARQSDGSAADAIGCNASTRSEPIGLGLPPITLCAVGRANQRTGECDARLPMAIDDWALSGHSAAYGSELEQCALDHCDNEAMRKMVMRLYDASGGAHGDAASRLARFTTQRESPLVEGRFAMSYRGEEDVDEDGTPPFIEVTGNEDGPRFGDFATTPFSRPYRDAHDAREQCFLGARCNRHLF